MEELRRNYMEEIVFSEPPPLPLKELDEIVQQREKGSPLAIPFRKVKASTLELTITPEVNIFLLEVTRSALRSIE